MRYDLPDADVKTLRTAPRPPALTESQEPCHGIQMRYLADVVEESPVARGNFDANCLTFRPEKCMLNRQIDYFISKYGRLAKFTAAEILHCRMGKGPIGHADRAFRRHSQPHQSLISRFTLKAPCSCSI